MTERLREVADHLAALRVNLLGQQAHVVDGCHGPLEGRGGLVDVPGQLPMSAVLWEGTSHVVFGLALEGFRRVFVRHVAPAGGT